MKQSEVYAQGVMNTPKPRRRLSLKVKLIGAFLFFTIIMLVVLWLFQTVFLDDFYKVVKTKQIKKAADYISVHINDEDIGEYMKDVSDRNGMTIGVYDTSRELFRRIYTTEFANGFGMDIMPHEIYACYEKAKQSGGMAVIDDDRIYLEKDFLGQIKDRGDMPQFEHNTNTRLTCAKIVTQEDGKEYMIILRSSVSPVSSTVHTLRIQLVIVTVILGGLGVLLAVLVSAHISKPLSRTNKGAKELAKQNYAVTFSDEGYKEIRELNSTLNYAAKELSAVDRLRRELISNISHDLRTPLTMISGYAEVMRDIPGENSPENLQVIIDESQRLSQLVTDLLDLSKLESGNIPFEKVRFCLTDSIRSIFIRYEKLVADKQCRIIFEQDKDAYVVGDEVRLSQVVYNLINNAINYSREDKTVVVRQVIADNKVRIEITDKGEGIPAEDLPNIWDRYYRVDKEHKSAVIGSGLGLSIAKNVLMGHNARFGVRSTPGVGSTFWFELEMAKEK